MKKILTILISFVLFFSLQNTQAQTNSTTVADGTNTSSYIPIYGSYMSSWLHTQIIYPENMLADLVGGTISEISFYTSAPAFNYAWQAPMRIKMGITESNSFTTANYLTDSLETVYLGTLEVVAGVMNIVFDTPFTYPGGNILLEFVTEVKTPNYKSATFKGVSTESYMSIRGYNASGLDAIINQTRHNFIPKTTFTYTGGVSCLSPMAVTLSDIAEHSATLNITPRNGQNEWEYRLVEASADTTGMPWVVTTDTNNNLINLDDNTSYIVYVRTLCGGETSATTSAQFRTLCSPIDEVPVLWDFETENVAGSLSYPLPSCWSRLPSNSTYPYSYNFNPAHAHNGSYCLYFSSTGTQSICILPEIDTMALPISMLQLEFFAKTTVSYVSADIEVGVIGDPEDITTFQPYDTFTIQSAAYPAEPYVVMFNEFIGYGNHLAMRMSNASTTIMNICVDDVTLNEIPPCPKVQQLAVTNVGENSISLSWNGLNDSYLVRYRAENESEWDYEIVFEDSITLVGLNPNTIYIIDVAPNCDEILESMYQHITASTACAPVSVPYFLDFENTNMFVCWTIAQHGVIEDYYGDMYFPTIETSSSNARSGTKYMEIGAQEGYTAFLVAPKVDQDIENLRMEFYAREPQAYLSANVLGTLQVGLMSTPMDTSSFVLLTTIPVSGTNYSHKTVSFDQYSFTGDDYYIAFRYIGAGSDTDNISGIFIDDIIITVNASCTEPTALNATGMTQSSADLSWNSTANNFNLYYRASDETVFTVVPATLTDGVFTLTGLQPSTIYYWYVSALCDDGTEAPSLLHNFITDCGIYSVFPFQEDFNSYGSAAMPHCWDMLPGIVETDYSLPMTIMNGTYTQYAHSAPTSMVFGSTDIQSATAIMPPFSVSTQSLRLTFYAKPEGVSSGTLKVGYITNPADSSTFVEVFSLATSNLTEYSYHEYMVNFDVTNAPDSSRIAFRYECATDWLFFIDDIVVSVIPNCDAPIQLNASFITSTAVNLSWVSNSEEVTLHYKTLPDNTFNTMQVFLDSAGVYQFTGLTPSTTYQWYLTIECDDSTYVSETSSFTTDCAGIIVVPQTWTFETGNTGGTTSYPLPPCWHRIHSSFPYSYHSSLYNYAHTGTRCLFFNTASGNLYATLPPINTDDLSIDTLQLKFFARVYSTSQPYNLEVGMMNDPMDASTFVALDTFHLTSGIYNEVSYRVNFDNYTGGGNYIAFRCMEASSANVYIDDVTLQSKPDCEPVDELTVSNITTNSATLTWTEEEDISVFIVEYKTVAATSWTTQTVNAMTYTFTGLTPGTTYDVRVKPDCSESVEYVSLTFSTQCDAITVFPYNESFENGDFGCWTPLVTTGGGIWQNHQFTSIFQYPQDGNRYVYYHSTAQFSLSEGLLVSPVFDLSQMYVPAVSFFFDAFGDSYAEDSIALLIRTSENDTWHFLKGYGGRDGIDVSWQNDTVNLIMPTSTYQIAFMGISLNGGGIFLDNITVLEHATAIDSIQEPTVVTNPASNISQTGATMNGAITDPGSEPFTAQGFEWKSASDNDYQTVSATGDVFTYDLTNLTPGTTYTYRAFVTTAYMTTRGADVTFTTPTETLPCNTPTDLTVGTITHESIAVSWDANADVSNWDIRYSTTGGASNTVTSNTNSFTISGLTPETTYQIQVRANCSDGQTSDWSASVTATTEPNGIDNHLLNSIVLYPNPANDVINVQCTMYNVQLIEVVDVYGKVISAYNVIDNSVRINVSSLASGMYFVRVRTEEGFVTKSFVKK